VTWWRKFGSAEMPIRQSSLNSIASQNGCAKRFFYEMEATLSGTLPPERPHWKRVLGTAVHAVIERALTKTWPQLEQIYGPGAPRPLDATSNWAPRALRLRVDEVLREELRKAANGAPVEWMDADPDTEMLAAIDMVVGGLRTVVERAARIVACEAPFTAELEGYCLVGTIDLLFEPRDAVGTVALADWKTGERKLPQAVIDHGYQIPIYSHAVAEGTLWPGDAERETHLGMFPSSSCVVHLRDFVPYVRGPKKGQLRGPGWYAARRVADDVARLRVSLRDVVGTVRMGRRLEQIGEQCARCPFRGPCLGDGSGPTRQEQLELERALAGVDLSGVLPDVA
jgi:hypothetical protein